MAEEIEFEQFVLERVIDESSVTKSITFQGTYKGQTAVIRLEKTPFNEVLTKTSINDPGLSSERNLVNDIYSRYRLTPTTSSINDLKAIVVIPANETVLTKYGHHKTVFFTETSDTYKNIVEPFIANMLITQKDYNQWVYNILDGKSESDRIILNDDDQKSGFMLLPSIKSSGDEKDIHLIAISHRRDIRSLRDLDDSHLALLKNILEKGTKAIENKFNSKERSIRSYIHYHPTFYHFHVHFELVDPSEYKSSDRDNLLTTVINNITLTRDYYKKATLSYPISVALALYKEFERNNLL